MRYATLWQVDMGDGTWAVCCLACRLALYRGPKPQADRVFRTPPLRARHPPRPASPPALTRAAPHSGPVGGASPDPPRTDAPPTTNPQGAPP
jgi:hypothetical protein